jgi:hypothetical protein
MRTKLASHIKVSKLGIGWFAALITPSGEGHNRVEMLGRSDTLAGLVEDCGLNSTFDRERKDAPDKTVQQMQTKRSSEDF